MAKILTKWVQILEINGQNFDPFFCKMLKLRRKMVQKLSVVHIYFIIA